jgi:hypothetical protein
MTVYASFYPFVIASAAKQSRAAQNRPELLRYARNDEVWGMRFNR